jgi:hypothetical protein
MTMITELADIISNGEITTDSSYVHEIDVIVSQDEKPHLKQKLIQMDMDQEIDIIQIYLQELQIMIGVAQEMIIYGDDCEMLYGTIDE